MPSGFSPPVANWLEMGGRYAFVHARGSGALGDAWQRAGQRDGKTAAVDDVLAASRVLDERGLIHRGRVVAHAAGHSSLILLAVLQRDPSLARAVWLSYPIADPLSMPPTVPLVAEYGPRPGADALVTRLLSLDAPGLRTLPPVLITLSLDQPAEVVEQSRRLVEALREYGHSDVLLRALDVPSGDELRDVGWRVKDERVDVYAFLAHAVGAGATHTRRAP